MPKLEGDQILEKCIQLYALLIFLTFVFLWKFNDKDFKYEISSYLYFDFSIHIHQFTSNYDSLK